MEEYSWQCLRAELHPEGNREPLLKEECHNLNYRKITLSA